MKASLKKFSRVVGLVGLKGQLIVDGLNALLLSLLLIYPQILTGTNALLTLLALLEKRKGLRYPSFCLFFRPPHPLYSKNVNKSLGSSPCIPGASFETNWSHFGPCDGADNTVPSCANFLLSKPLPCTRRLFEVSVNRWPPKMTSNPGLKNEVVQRTTRYTMFLRGFWQVERCELFPAQRIVARASGC